MKYNLTHSLPLRFFDTIFVFRERERKRGDMRKRSPFFKNCVTCLIWGRKSIRVTMFFFGWVKVYCLVCVVFSLVEFDIASPGSSSWNTLKTKITKLTFCKCLLRKNVASLTQINMLNFCMRKMSPRFKQSVGFYIFSIASSLS